MCNCLNDIKSATLDYLKKEKADIGVITDGRILNTGISLSGSGRFTYTDFEYEMQNIKKGGILGAIKKHKIALNHSYCPWCGEKHTTQE